MICPNEFCAALTGAALLLSGCTDVSDDAAPPPTPVAAPVDGAAICPPRPLDRVYDQTLPRNGNHDAALIDDAVRLETNRERCARGLPALEAHAALQQAAFLHAQDMARLGIFSHNTPVPGRETPGDRVTQVGFRWQNVAENITESHYMDYENGAPYTTIDAVRCEFAYADGRPIPPQTYASLARSVVARWMGSEGHRANLLSPDVVAHGFAIFPNGDTALCGGLYGTQVMAR
ncbi:MAG: CAP domain-containing protein [Pseudomonadota bacterium]